ncbi:class D sortase [Bacillus sp. CGMCC 1.16541]|uniref:class D sortase n=1 Tax=Bacillus sp. CGMCC 1.16541 TaxID=2185143 RepID=UPI000D72ED11|nr:class D sortase [Bacillus sp. CGMCC 1.16541]
MVKWIGIAVITIGLSLIGYWYMEWSSATASVDKMEKAEVEKLQSYTFTSIKPAKQSSPPPQTHKNGDQIATLFIPLLQQKYTVYWGTDEQTLTQGVGMYDSDVTTTPAQYGHTLLSGHRDTVFTQLKNVNVHDTLIVHYDGTYYEYTIQKQWITHKDDTTVIQKMTEPTLTLSTCYPFRYIGDAPERYILQATLTGVVSEEN